MSELVAEDLLRESIFVTDHRDYSVDHLRDQILGFGRIQAMKKAVLDIIPIIEKEDIEGLDQVRSVIDGALKVGSAIHDKGLELGSILTEVGTLVSQDRLHSAGNKLSSGFPTIDAALYGGFAPTELWVIQAPTKVGKSTMLINLAAAAITQQRPVFYYTFELRTLDVILRMASRLSKIPMNIIGANADDAYRTWAENFQQYAPYLRVVYAPPGRMSVDGMRASMLRLAEEDGQTPALLVVDYADLMRKDRNDDNTYLAMGDIYQQLIGIGYDFSMPVLTASQTQRSAAKLDLIGTDATGDSYRKATDSDGIISVQRTDKEKESNLLRLYIAGARRGEDGLTIPCQTAYDRMLIRECSQEDYDAAHG